MIELTDVHVDLAGRRVLSGITTSVRAGDSVAIIGRNAAGKTTLVRTMAGFIAVRTGRVMLDGRSVAELAPRVRAARIAFVAQRPVVAAPFSVRESIALGRYARGADAKRVDAAIERFGLAECAERPFHGISVGQQQRAALARAFAQVDARSILLLDEPFAALDLGETARCAARIREHAAGGGAVVAVLHDLAQATALASRVWVLVDGRMAADGSTREVLTPGRLAHWFGIDFDEGPHGPVARLHSFP
ncbi:MAG: ABC transporter ATP-binding protein [Phycisphaerae bacterium]|nr:ABC transporter ATP-binding protein [Phycisphaerae bacterium]MDZ4831972.1 ABC transporter ATP-binding protein [Phycisphaerae bacterium]